jgi:hypothetical protein
MNSRHTAALALVGWYLMTPPLTKTGDVNLEAPLAQWKITNSFDTAIDCRTVLLQVQGYLPNPETGKKGPITTNPRQTNLVCIATDDPRLKEAK